MTVLAAPEIKGELLYAKFFFRELYKLRAAPPFDPVHIYFPLYNRDINMYGRVLFDSIFLCD